MNLVDGMRVQHQAGNICEQRVDLVLPGGTLMIRS